MSQRLEKILVVCVILVTLSIVWGLVGKPLYSTYKFRRCYESSIKNNNDGKAVIETVKLESILEVCTGLYK